VNKGFVHNMLDSEDTGDQNKFHYLAEEEQFSATEIDFGDPAALLRRQKAILEAIQKHSKGEQFDPLRILTRGLGIWIVILCHGGKFLL
jgi:hypothetical protein